MRYSSDSRRDGNEGRGWVVYAKSLRDFDLLLYICFGEEEVPLN